MPILDQSSFYPQGGGGGLLGFLSSIFPQQQTTAGPAPQSSDGPAGNNGLPMNIAPPQQQQAPEHPFYNDNFFSRLALAIAPPGSAAFKNMQQQRQLEMVYQSLQQAGLPEPLARVGALHPEALSQFAPGYITPPQATNYQTPQGTGGTAYYDPQSRSYKDFASGQPVGQAQPNYAQAGSSPYTAGAPPPGVDINKYRQDEAQRIAQSQQELREKAEGAIDFLPDAIRVQDDLRSGKYNNAIGPVEGNSLYNNYVRGLGASVDEALGSPVGARQNLGAYNEFSATLNRLASKNLKAQYGARPSLPEVQMNQQTFGGVQAADANTAHNILSQRVLANFETLQRGVDAGIISPNALPPALVQRGVQMGALNPRSFGINPQSVGQQQQQPVGQQQMGGQMTVPANNARVPVGQPQAAPGQGGPATAGAIPPAAQRKVGQTYSTPKGKFVWMGNGWQAAQ